MVMLAVGCSFWSFDSDEKYRAQRVLLVLLPICRVPFLINPEETSQMEIFMSVVLGDLTSRSISFIINKIYSNKSPELTVEDSLQRALLRAEVIVDEAMGRRITNHAILLQLIMLRDAMHRGHYMLDSFRYQPHDEEAKDQAVSHSSSLYIVNSIKRRLCFSKRVDSSLKELQVTLDNLNSKILDVNELVLFLMNCPRLCRQPYNMHLQLANCMFGRQMEAELVLRFLLHPQPHGDEGLEVMPIIGAGQVGKTTLVTHVCKDERVRAYFSEILFFHIQSFTDDEQVAFRKECARKHQNHMSNSNKNMRFLVFVELVGDLNEDAWNRLHSASKCCVPSGTKIIVTSRFDKIGTFGTTGALILKHLPHEAYWYFFKTLTFGSMDPETMHPRFMQVAMEIARTQRSSMIAANIIPRLLRGNFDVHFWLKVLAFWRGTFKNHISRFGEHPFELLKQNMTVCLGRMTAPSEDFVLYHRYQLSSEQDVPNIRIKDVLYGNVKPHGRFEAVAWTSRIPPYYSYVYSCEIQELKTRAVKRKRSTKNGVTNC